ncbi:MAG: RecQ family zinc-binding domain-containing protein [Collinsella sp.]
MIDRGDAADEALDDEQRAWALQNRYRLLSQMEGYCNTTGCLREYMLRYFGDEAAAEHAVAAAAGGTADDAEGCGNCSNCLTQFEVEDVTDMARAAVRYVAARPMRFGKSLIADVLPRRQHRAHSPDASGRGPRLR